MAEIKFDETPCPECGKPSYQCWCPRGASSPIDDIRAAAAIDGHMARMSALVVPPAMLAGIPFGGGTLKIITTPSKQRGVKPRTVVSNVRVDGVPAGKCCACDKLVHRTYLDELERNAGVDLRRCRACHERHQELYPACSYCNVPIVGEPTIRLHRDAMGEGPQMPLCNDCGGRREPSCEEIWDHTNEADVFAGDPLPELIEAEDPVSLEEALALARQAFR